MRSRYLVLFLVMLLTSAQALADTATVNKPGFFNRCLTWIKAHLGLGKAISSGTGSADRAGFVKKFDADGDGTLSQAELATAHQAWEKEMLAKFDADGDGVLNDTEKETMRQNAPRRGGPGHERRGGPPPMNASASQEMLATYDTDGDGSLSDSEKDAADEARQAEMVARFDSDGDGTLSQSEIASMPRRPGGHRKLSAEQMESRKQAMIEQYDTDGDGELSDTEKAAAKASFQGYYQEFSQDGD